MRLFIVVGLSLFDALVILAVTGNSDYAAIVGVLSLNLWRIRFELEDQREKCKCRS
jgi:hypothetical protein